MTTATPLTESDLAGFLIAHAGMRIEYGRLAAVARTASDPEHMALVEDQVALVTELLHNHHTAEDEEVWPRLRARAPHAVPELDRLESEHEVLDPLIARAADRTTPLRDRADALAEMHTLVNAHLDREESVAVPLILEHFTRAEWDALVDRADQEMTRRRQPLIFGWLASCGTPEQRSAALATVPAVARLLFRWFWWPSYRRRYVALYGGTAPELVLA
jgi:iron-sulfur cluster repair protein YtfE (RIC family)